MPFVGRTDVQDPGAQQDERERAQSVLAVLDVYREPMTAIAGSPVAGEHFQTAVHEAGRTIPQVSKQLIDKHLVDLARVGVLTRERKGH